MHAACRASLTAAIVCLSAHASAQIVGGDTSAQIDPRQGHTASLTPPSSGLALEARLSYEAWLFGRMAGQPIGDVMSSGVGTEIDMGLIVTPGAVIYLGWQHVFYGTGPLSPYADLPNNDARSDTFMVGARLGCGESNPRFGPELVGDLGYRQYRAEGSDNVGGSASVTLPALDLRIGGGVCYRPSRALVLSPTVMLDVSDAFQSFSGSVVSHTGAHDGGGSLATGSTTVALSPGIALSGELPF